jgi:hypothetical protein
MSGRDGTRHPYNCYLEGATVSSYLQRECEGGQRSDTKVVGDIEVLNLPRCGGQRNGRAQIEGPISLGHIRKDARQDIAVYCGLAIEGWIGVSGEGMGEEREWGEGVG